MDSVSDVFDSVMSLIRTDCENSNENMTPVVYNTWLNDLGFSQFEGNTVTLTVPLPVQQHASSTCAASMMATPSLLSPGAAPLSP